MAPHKQEVPMRKGIGSLLAVAAAVCLLASPAAAKDHRDGHGNGSPPTPAAHVCDPIDPSLCLLPWPNNYFTRPDRSTPTGLRLDISPLATPTNAAGTPIDPTDWNRLDGFSPGSQIVTHV